MIMLITQNTFKQFLHASRSCHLWKRWKFKKKHAKTSKKLGPEVRALQFFDKYYSPLFGNQWPSIRIALLSRPKHCALVNSFSKKRDTIVEELFSAGTFDINSHIISRANKKTYLKQLEIDKEKNEETKAFAVMEQGLLEVRNIGCDKEVDELAAKDLKNEEDQYMFEEIAEESEMYTGRVGQVINLHDFIPPAKVYTQDELTYLQQQEQSDPVDKENLEKTQFLTRQKLHIPVELRVHVFPKGNISRFKPPSGAAYYLMDVASILPVYALSLAPNCRVLDLCSGPGGKALAMMQTMNIGHLTCVDKSLSRLKRVRNTIVRYLGREEYEGVVEYHHMDGALWVAQNPDEIFDRVLVDVPCTTDRHVLEPDIEDSIFKVPRTKERLRLPKLQRELLMAGMQSCKPGGAVVYSTCSLSPGQNDHVVSSSISRIQNTSEMHFVVEDLTCLVEAFGDICYFADNCQYGQLVLPHLTSNFGPMYIAKIRRLN